MSAETGVVPAGSARSNGLARLLGLTLLDLGVLVPFLAATLAISFLSLGFGLLLVPPAVAWLRSSAELARRLSGQWSGVPIASPYRPAPPPEAGRLRRCGRLLGDPATWRDLAWSLANPVVGLFLAVLPIGFVLQGAFGMLLPFLWPAIGGPIGDYWFTFLHVKNQGDAWGALLLGLVYINIGFVIARPSLRIHGRWTHTLLAPTANAQLELRVSRLAETRADALDTQAAELRRIERDLHDGAQARLVAMGLNLGAAERLLESDPAAARALLTEMRTSSSKALEELRDLVRGIHPPVLADRGLADAVRALGLDSPLDVEVAADLPDPAEPPVESAVYFAVSELLTNAARHAGARSARVDLRFVPAYGETVSGIPAGTRAGKLRVTVSDDGHGGADPARGTGLRGISRRLGAFDGTLTVASPAGGPTVATLEVPCVSSSPRTSSS